MPSTFFNYEEYYNKFKEVIDNEIKMVEREPKETFNGTFKFDQARSKHISRRIVISVQNYIKIVESDILKVTIYYSAED